MKNCKWLSDSGFVVPPKIGSMRIYENYQTLGANTLNNIITYTSMVTYYTNSKSFLDLLKKTYFVLSS